MSKDYLSNKEAAQEMADTVANWWHSRGYTQVRTWLEKRERISPYGTKLQPDYLVRGNIKMSVDTIPNGMVD